MRTNPVAVFMAFGTKGDVYPIAAIAAAFASDQNHYQVAFLTHSAHQSLKGHLAAKGIAYFPISSPPVLSIHQDNDFEGSMDTSFSLQKKEITRKHRQDCVSTIETIYGEDSIIDGDLIFINFFALVTSGKAGVLQNFSMSDVLLLLLMLFHTVLPLLLNASSGMSILFYTNIFEKLAPVRLVGMMSSIGCGHFSLKIGESGEALT